MLTKFIRLVFAEYIYHETAHKKFARILTLVTNMILWRIISKVIYVLILCKLFCCFS